MSEELGDPVRISSLRRRRFLGLVGLRELAAGTTERELTGSDSRPARSGWCKLDGHLAGDVVSIHEEVAGLGFRGERAWEGSWSRS
jgi:hypothetical protein